MSTADGNGSGNIVNVYRSVVFAFAAFVILGLPFILWILTPYLPIPFLDLLTIANIVTSLLLSLVLVYIYISLRDVQDTQTDILDSQESLMRLQNLPKLTITSWGAKNNTLDFTLSNLGEGVATAIFVDIRVLPQTIEYSEDFNSSPKPLFQANEDTRKSFLSGKETLTFVGPATATTVVDNVQDWVFTRVINHLCAKGEERVELIIEVEYTDLFGERTRIPVTSRLTEIHEDMTFEEAMTGAKATNTVVQRIPLDTELEQYGELDERGLFFDPRNF